MLFTGCIFDNNLPSALRISVMSRHTLNDGVTSDKRIIGQYDFHFPILGPSSKLIGNYYKRGLSWEDFSSAYIVELAERNKSLAVDHLSKLSLQENVVILCIEDSPMRCHRRLLAEECNRRFPTLEITVG